MHRTLLHMGAVVEINSGCSMDVLSCLRRQWLLHASVQVQAEHVVLDDVHLPRGTPVIYSTGDQLFYTLAEVLFLLQHADVCDADYAHACREANVRAVALVEKRDLIAFLAGQPSVVDASQVHVVQSSVLTPAAVIDDLAQSDAARRRALAMAMALHRRLGAASHLRLLMPELIARIALFDRLQATRHVVAITVRTGLLVDSIAFHFSHGGSSVCGGHGGIERPLFRLTPGEYITRIRGRMGAYVDAIQFETSHGRVSPMCGGPGGDAFEFAAPSGSEIFAINARLARGWLCRLAPFVRSAPRAAWSEHIERLRLHGFAVQQSFITRPPRQGS